VRTGDTFAVPVALAVAIGRLACFVGGCCFGRETSLPWGVVFPAQGPDPRHPTQLYEFAFHLLAAAFLWLCEKRGWFPSQRIKLYILAYLIYRFLSEFLRPEPELWLALTAYQWAALAFIPLFAWLWRVTAGQIAQEARSGPLAKSSP
jgi:phosphatidylglycerol:prolipoprotein diacylglycerol transferase